MANNMFNINNLMNNISLNDSSKTNSIINSILSNNATNNMDNNLENVPSRPPSSNLGIDGLSPASDAILINNTSNNSSNINNYRSNVYGTSPIGEFKPPSGGSSNNNSGANYPGNSNNNFYSPNFNSTIFNTANASLINAGGNGGNVNSNEKEYSRSAPAHIVGLFGGIGGMNSPILDYSLNNMSPSQKPHDGNSQRIGSQYSSDDDRKVDDEDDDDDDDDFSLPPSLADYDDIFFPSDNKSLPKDKNKTRENDSVNTLKSPGLGSSPSSTSSSNSPYLFTSPLLSAFSPLPFNSNSLNLPSSNSGSNSSSGSNLYNNFNPLASPNQLGNNSHDSANYPQSPNFYGSGGESNGPSDSSQSGSPGNYSPDSGTPTSPNTAPYGEHPFGEHPSRTLFVRNINSNVDDEELRLLFETYGPIRSMYTQCKHRGFVMISYFDIRHAKSAMRHLQSKVIRRRKLDIHYSIPKDNPSEKDQNQGTLVVFNLDPSITCDELRKIFGTFGEIKEIRETPNKKHHKFIEFYDVRDADKAMKSLNKTEIKSKKIKIEPSRPGGARKNLITNPSSPNQNPQQPGMNDYYYDDYDPSYSPSFSPSTQPLISPSSPRFGSGSDNEGSSNAPNYSMFNKLSAMNNQGNNGMNNSAHRPRSRSSLKPTTTPLLSSPLLSSSPPSSGGFVSSSGNSPSIFNNSNPSANVPRPMNNNMNYNAMNNNMNSMNINNMNNMNLNNNINNMGNMNNMNNMNNLNNMGMNMNNMNNNMNNINSMNNMNNMNNMNGINNMNMNNLNPMNNLNLNIGINPNLNNNIGNWALLNSLNNYNNAPMMNNPNLGIMNNVGSMSAPNNNASYTPTTVTNTPPVHSGGPHKSSRSVSLPVKINYNNNFPPGSNPAMNNNNPPHDDNTANVNYKAASPTSSPKITPTSPLLTPISAPPPSSSSSSSVSYVLVIEEVLKGLEKRTTLMIKNIPNKYTQKMLLATIDEHHKGLYDFFYLPIDFKNKCNVGYAFINFIDPISIVSLYNQLHNNKWEKFNSEKVCEITYARIQGKESLINHFQNSSLMSEDKKCRPIIFHSDGPNQGQQAPFPIGPNVRVRSTNPGGNNGNENNGGIVKYNNNNNNNAQRSSRMRSYSYK